MRSVALHYRTSGTGSPVFILHGLFGSSRNWLSISKKLAEQYQVITPDLRNHGESPHSHTMDYPAMATDVFALAKKLDLDKYTLIGHSMGGKVAMQMALEQPDMINRLMVLDIAPVEYRHRYGKLFTAMNGLPVDTITNRREAEERFCPDIGDTNLCRFLLQNLVRTENGFAWRINLTALENKIDSIAAFPRVPPAKQYDGPCLFLGGGNSDFIVQDHVPAIKRLFPAAEVRWLDHAGHLLHAEQPAVILDIMLDFLSN